MVVGDRQVRDHEEFSRVKKLLQLWGSWVVRRASGTAVPDTTSGFRAYNREAAIRLNVVSRFSYTLETIIQAGSPDLAVAHVPIRTNARTRESGSSARRSSTSSARSRRSCGSTRCTSRSGSSSGLRPFRPPCLRALRPLRLVCVHAVRADGSSDRRRRRMLILAFQLAALGVLADLLRGNRVLAERTLHESGGSSSRPASDRTRWRRTRRRRRRAQAEPAVPR